MTATGKKVHYQVREQASARRRGRAAPAPVSDRPAQRPGRDRDRRASRRWAMTRPETWAGLVDGRSGIGPDRGHSTPGRLPVQIAGEIHGFDAEAVLGPKRFRRSARFSPAGDRRRARGGRRRRPRLRAPRPRPDRRRDQRGGARGARRSSATSARCASAARASSAPTSCPRRIPTWPACEVAIDLGVHGPVNASALACASGTYALLEARQADPDRRGGRGHLPAAPMRGSAARCSPACR